MLTGLPVYDVLRARVTPIYPITCQNLSAVLAAGLATSALAGVGRHRAMLCSTLAVLVAGRAATEAVLRPKSTRRAPARPHAPTGQISAHRLPSASASVSAGVDP